MPTSVSSPETPKLNTCLSHLTYLCVILARFTSSVVFTRTLPSPLSFFLPRPHPILLSHPNLLSDHPILSSLTTTLPRPPSNNSEPTKHIHPPTSQDIQGNKNGAKGPAQSEPRGVRNGGRRVGKKNEKMKKKEAATHIADPPLQALQKRINHPVSIQLFNNKSAHHNNHNQPRSNPTDSQSACSPPLS